MIKKIPTDQLSIGMFVCGNDRKWLETPFFRKKFLLKTEQQVAELREYCKFVQIDTDKGIDVSTAELPEVINTMQGCNHETGYDIYPVGSIVELDNGQMAIVLKTDSMKRLTPEIELVTDTNKNILSAPEPINLADPVTQRHIVGKLSADDPLIEFINLFCTAFKPS